MSVNKSSATPKSSATTCTVVPELAAPVVTDKAPDVDVMGDTAPVAAVCLPGGLNGSTGEEDPVDVSLIPGSQLAAFVPSQMFEGMMPQRCSIKCSIEDTCVLMPKFNLALLPWPSFKCSQFWALLVKRVSCEQGEQLSYLVAMATRATPLWLRVPSVHHVMQPHNDISWGLQRLRPPWPPPELEMIDFHREEAGRGGSHRLDIVDRIVPHSLGTLVSSPSATSINDTSSPNVNGCRNHVSWRLPKCCSVTPCVQLADAILDVSSWQWITSNYIRVQFQFLYPLFPVNCHFARVNFMSYSRAQMYIAWLLEEPSYAHPILGRNECSIIDFTVKTVGLQRTEILCSSLLIQWPEVLISALFFPAGKASLYGYGAADFQWEIAWLTTTHAHSIPHGMHLFLTLECCIVICYMEIEIRPPWPLPGYIKMCKGMLQVLLLNGLVLKGMQLLWPGKYTLSPLSPNRSTTCRNSNIHDTTDIIKISRNWQVLETVELGLRAALTVIIFTPEV